MREEYFNIDNISAVCSDLLAETAEYRKSIEFDCIAEHTALIVLDMQNYFYLDSSHAKIPSINAIIPNINSLISTFESLNLPIIFTKHYNNSVTPGSMNKFWNRVLDKGTEDFNIIKPIRVPDNSIIIEKTQYDAFFGTNLDSTLINNQVENLIICGVFTHLCVETTIRSAFCHDYTIFFPIDATATYNRQFHKSSLINLGHGFAYPYLSADLIRIINSECK